MSYAAHQLGLFNDPIEEQFLEFHHAHPEVYRKLRALAFELLVKGHKRIGMGMLYEVLRWQWIHEDLIDEDGFKLNNNYRSRYSRLLMASEPRLKGVITIRRLATGDDE